MEILRLNMLLLSWVAASSGSWRNIANLVVNDVGLDLMTVNDWLFVVKSNMPQATFDAVCETQPRGQCSVSTNGRATKFIREHGDYATMLEAATQLLPWIVVIEPDPEETVFDDEVTEEMDSFLQRRAAT